MDLFPVHLSFWSIRVFFSFLLYRTGTVHGTPPTQTLPSVFRIQYWCGSLVSICGCWLPSTAFISTAMTMDAFRSLASAPPKWWDFTWRLWQSISLHEAFSFEKKVFSFLIDLLLLCCSGPGLLAGILRLCGVFLYSFGEKSGDPPAHGLPTEPHHTEHDCGNFFFTFSESHINIFPLYSCLDLCMENYWYPIHLLPKLYRWVTERILEIFHSELPAKMSQLSQIIKTQGRSDKQLGIDLPCCKQCKYNSTLKTQPSLTITYQGEDQSTYRWHNLLFDLERIMENSSTKQTLIGRCWKSGRHWVRGSLFWQTVCFFFLQLTMDSSWIIDPPLCHANTGIVLSGVPKRDGSVRLLRRQTQNHWM